MTEAATAQAPEEELRRREYPEEADGTWPGPVGLRALCAACARLYPDQPNPLQVTARVKYWLGGPDPLDYISMYWNPGRPELSVPPHWHYISLGVSDLHGDGRVHAPPAPAPAPTAGPTAAAEPPPSGFGFEMSFRLAAPPPPAPPPVWPAALLQSLARYIFTSGVRLCVGDHISWHAPLDGGSSSRIRHMLVAEDAQLRTVRGPLGAVQFVQLVGATGRELRAAQRGAGAGVLRAMSASAACGGAWLVTDVARRASCAAVRAAADAQRRQPADLAGVSTALRWAEWTPHQSVDEEQGQEEEEESLSATVQEEIKSLLQRGLHNMTPHEPTHDADQLAPPAPVPPSPSPSPHRDSVVKMSTESARVAPVAPSQLSTDSLKQIFTGGGAKEISMSAESLQMWSVARALEEAGAGEAGEGGGARALSGVHLVFNAEGGSLLPLALKGRVLHSRHFTWRCSSGARAVTFVSCGVSGALVSQRRPYVATAHGWLQVLVPAWLAREMAARTACLERALDSDSEGEAAEGEEEGGGGGGGGGAAPPVLPLALTWPSVGLKITVLHPDTPLY